MRRYDYVVVGSGIAGLFAALEAREHGSVLVITKGSVEDGNTKYAQGGIAAAIGADDSPELHLKDTLDAGAGLVDEQVATILTDAAPDRIADLAHYGVPFDSVDGAVALGREGAHSRERILHAGGDSTGFHIELTLSDVVRHSRVTVLEHSQVLDVVVEDGKAIAVAALDSSSGVQEDFACGHLILATGGAGRLFRVTTNPTGATADGVALAYRAGAEVMDMEFIQFHPTALRLPEAPVFLISEAVRGEGALLLNGRGQRFMPQYHDAAELAPRDIVARAIIAEMMRLGDQEVFLDVTGLPSDRTAARFPQIMQHCAQYGLDLTRDLIPVSPAAHYMMGGIRTNSWGETNLDGLYACGETACTGVHGANRLASNSLLETVVFAKRVIERSLSAERGPLARTEEARSLAEDQDLPQSGLEQVPTLTALQSLMWEKVGVLRDGDGLNSAVRQTATWSAEQTPQEDRSSQELRNLLHAGRLASEAALAREESRGAHYRTDFPESIAEWRRHVVFRRDA